MPLSPFEQLVTGFDQKLESIVESFNSPVPPNSPYDVSCPPAHRNSQAFLVIQLQITWSEFTESLLKISVQGGHSTLSGTVLPIMPSGSTPEQQIRGAVRRAINKSTFSDAAWHSCAFVSMVVSELTLQNEPAITLSLGSDSAASNTTAVRNFLVHPGNRSRPAYNHVANQYGLPRAGPIELLNHPQIGGISLFEIWVSSMKATAYNAAQ